MLKIHVLIIYTFYFMFILFCSFFFLMIVGEGEAQKRLIDLLSFVAGKKKLTHLLTTLKYSASAFRASTVAPMFPEVESHSKMNCVNAVQVKLSIDF